MASSLLGDDHDEHGLSEVSRTTIEIFKRFIEKTLILEDFNKFPP